MSTSSCSIVIQEWDGGLADIFAEGEHTPEEFREAVNEHFGFDYFRQEEIELSSVRHGDFFRLDTPPDGYYAYYYASAEEASGRPGKMIRATFLAP